MEVRIPSVAPVAFLLGCGVVTAGFLLVPSDMGPEVLHASVGFAAVGAIVVGVVHHQPVHRLAWVLQAVGLTSILVAQLVGWWDAEAGTERFPAPADALILLGLAVLVASMAVRVRVALVDRDPFGSIDTAIMGVAAAVLALVFLVEPILVIEGATAVEQVWAVAHPVVAVVLLAALARLVLGTASRSSSLLLTATGMAMLVGGQVALRLGASPVAGGVGSAMASGSGPVHLGFLVAWALLGASAVDPSMADRLAPPAGGAHIQPGRMAVVLTFVLLAPTVLVVHVVVADQARPMFLVASAVATMAGLVLALARMAFVVGSVETRTVKAGEDRFEALVEHSTDVIGVVDREGMVIYVSPAFRTALGRDPDGFVGSALRRIAHPDDVATLTTHLFQASTRARHATSRFETRLLATDGTVREFEVVAANLVGDGVVDGLALTMRDITDRKALAAELSHQAFHDSLTGLANRALFADRVDHALHRRRRDPDCAIAVLFVDLDDFKAVNDGLGHGAGDTLLRAVGQRIVRCLRAGDTAARLGGDEFAVLLEDDRAPSEAATIAARILDALRVPVSIGDMELGVVASIGLTVADATSTTVGLLRNADIAMYEAKRGGKGRVSMFDPVMRESASDRLALQTDLSAALEHGELRVVYQPIVALDTGLVGGAEALVRWTHPERGEVMPDSFIPVAEQTGLVVPIGAWVLTQACEQAARTGSTIGVNVSGVQFSAPDFLDTVAHALEDSGLPPARLTVEITETALMADTNATAQLLDRLRAVGVRIAIDDFGTGYCSLAYLQRFAVDMVKIDKTFVAELNERSKGSRLAQTILQMADSLDVTTVVAEGIETEPQLDQLRAFGCHYGQGFLLSRPLEQDAYHALLAEHQPDLAVSVTR